MLSTHLPILAWHRGGAGTLLLLAGSDGGFRHGRCAHFNGLAIENVWRFAACVLIAAFGSDCRQEEKEREREKRILLANKLSFHFCLQNRTQARGAQHSRHVSPQRPRPDLKRTKGKGLNL